MDAIVAGKQEKTEGSLVFKSKTSYNLNTYDLSTKVNPYGNANTLRFITVSGDTIILPLRSLVLGYNPAEGTKILNNWDTAKVVGVSYDMGDNNLLISGADTNFYLNTVFQSIEIGTLE